jgi:replication factor C subunit 3/5
MNNNKMRRNYDILPWVEKYRPQTLDDIISHTDVISTLKIFLQKKTLPHILFYGLPGTGKTSAIMACARELYGNYYDFMVMELNASDDRGIEVVRNKIKCFVSNKNVFFKEKGDIFKLVILDETDAMTSDAQAILRQIIEKYTRTARFCLICNYIQNITPALQSRCQKFRFSPIPSFELTEKIYEIAKYENIKLDITGANAIIHKSNGDMRKVINNLQSISMAYDKIDEYAVNTFLGSPTNLDINKIINSLINDTFESSFVFINNLQSNMGYSLNDIIFELNESLQYFIINMKSNIYSLNKLSINNVCNILSELRFIEFNLAVSSTEYIQLMALIGLFKNNK